jgi:hypothetical protein
MTKGRNIKNLFKIIRMWVALPLYLIAGILIWIGNKIGGESWFVGMDKVGGK